MSLDTSLSMDFGDGTYIFRLGVAEIEELEDKRGMGVLRLYQRIRGNDFRVGDLRETIRLGLIGGGLEPVKALRLVTKYVQPPLMRFCEPAIRILQPAIVTPDPDLGKSPAVVTAKETEHPNGSSPPLSTL